MRKYLALAVAFVLTAPFAAVAADSNAQHKQRVLRALMSHDPRSVQYIYDEIVGDLWLENGLKISDAASVLTISDSTLSEDLTLTATANLWSFGSTTSATFAFTPALSLTGDLTLVGGASGLTFSGSASSIVVDDNDTTALVIGSTDLLNLLTLDTGNNTETVIVTGTAAATSFHVDTGLALFDEDVTINGGSGALTVKGPIATGPWFEATFNEGAAKGVSLYSPLAAAYATTADAVQILAYGQQHKFAFVTNTTATGTITPAGTALGLDLNAGSPGNSDEWTMTTGMSPSDVGGMIIPGTTPAWEACATVDATDVSEVAGLWLLVTTPGAHVDLSGADPNYTSYAGIGIEQTDIVVSDNTDGAVDTAIDAVDLTSVALCIRGGSSGVITYYVDGTNRAAAATHTLGDGVPHVVRLQGLNHTGTEAPMNIVSLSLLPQ